MSGVDAATAGNCRGKVGDSGFEKEDFGALWTLLTMRCEPARQGFRYRGRVLCIVPCGITTAWYKEAIER